MRVHKAGISLRCADEGKESKTLFLHPAGLPPVLPAKNLLPYPSGSER